MMEQLNAIWKERTGNDLTESEAWAMVDFAAMILENADKNLDAELNKQGGKKK